jgi:MFS transporter, SP family, arabinose:H+ symporter
MNNRALYFSAIVASLSGFLFGFDTVVISGAEQTIQELWQLSDLMHGLVISMALWGTVLGALMGYYPTEHWGRKNTLLMVGALYFVSAIGSAMAPEVYSLIFFRFIGGVGIGISTIVAPVYISEISPAAQRGKLTGMFQFNIVFGILMAYVSNALLRDFGEDAWRYMLGIEAIPCVLFMVLCFKIPESPRWLIIYRNDIHTARQIFRNLNPAAAIEELEQWLSAITLSVADNKDSKTRFTKALWKPVLLAFFIAFFNQLSGINAILYFAPRIFELSGLEKEAAFLQSVGIGIVNLIFTLIGLWLIARVGRKTLLYWGSVGYILSLGMCSWAFATGHVSLVPLSIFAFIAAHAIGQGAVIWVFISEIFPNQYRDKGQTLGCFTHWILAALLTLVFPKLVHELSPSLIFASFCFLMILQLFWIKFWVPETKGVVLEDMEKQILFNNK